MEPTPITAARIMISSPIVESELIMGQAAPVTETKAREHEYVRPAVHLAAGSQRAL